MPQAAQAYVVSKITLAELGELARQRKRKEFLEHLQKVGAPVQPPFAHPGFVMTVSLSYLEENGVSMPLQDRQPDIRKILDSDLTLLSSMDAESADLFVQFVKPMTFTEAALSRYYRDFSEENMVDVGKAMKDAVDYLVRGAEQVTTPDSMLLLFLV